MGLKFLYAFTAFFFLSINSAYCCYCICLPLFLGHRALLHVKSHGQF